MTRPRISVVDVKVKAMTAGKRKAAGKPKSWRVWVGQFRFGRRALYAKTVASTREECRRLIVEGPFFNTEPMRATIVLDPPKPQRRDRRKA